MSKTGVVHADILFVGLTRSPSFLGISYSAFMLNAIICIILFIYTSDFRYIMIIAPIVHFSIYYFAKEEPLFMELFLVSTKCSKGRVNLIYHKNASSYDPN